MTEIFKNLDSSFGELKKVRTITVCAMMVAASIVLSLYSIKIGPFIKIGLGTIVNQAVASLFGGGVGAIFNTITNVVKYFIKPDGDFAIAFTLNAALAGLIYGISYYKHPITVPRIVVTQFIVSLICNVIIGTYLLHILYGKVIMAILPARVIKNLVMLPIDTFIFYGVSQILQNIKHKFIYSKA